MNTKSVYIHIPFCISKCDYCDFFSVPVEKNIPDDYIAALKNELSWYCSFYSIDSFDTVYIGGGTPSLLSKEQLSDLLSFIAKKNVRQEFTIEMNPESLSEEKLIISQNLGVNRLSVGIQSFNENALKAVHRHCSVFAIEKSLDIIKKVWQGRLNLDVIAGLPKQNSNDFVDSLNKVLSYCPDHLSLYTLTIEDNTPLAKRIDNGEHWNSDKADDEWLIGRDILLNNGFIQYEVSNFCKAGKESLHNMSYWRQSDYIGIGSGATGSVYCYEKGKNGLRWTNTDNIEDYINFWRNNSNVTDMAEIPRYTEKLSLDIEEEEFFMMGLRTLYGVSDKEYKKRFGDFAPYYGNITERLKNIQHKISVNKTSGNECFYALSADNILFLNSILMEL